MKKIIATEDAPAAIGTYSQAVQVGNTVYISGQIPLDPKTMAIVSDDFAMQVSRVFENLQAIAHAAGGDLSHIVKLQIYLMDMDSFPVLNDVMSTYFEIPYPARAAVQVSRLPKDVLIEMDAILQLDV